MEKVLFSSKNSLILTDDSCCLSNEEKQELGIQTIPCMATINELIEVLKQSLAEKEFVLFVGTAPSLSIINDTVRDTAEFLDDKDKRLNATDRIKVINTSCFSGGLGLFVTWFARYLNAKPRTFDELEAISQFLANHIAHFFVEPKEKRWNNLIYSPRTGPINYDGGKFRGNKGVYNFIASDFRDNAYHQEEKVWICFSGPRKSDGEDGSTFAQARSLARQIKRCCPDSRLDLSHPIAPHPVASLPDDVIACFYLSTEVRSDEFGPYSHELQEREVDDKRIIARRNITKMTRIAQTFKKSPCPKF